MTSLNLQKGAKHTDSIICLSIAHPYEKKGQMKESKSLKIQNKMRCPPQFSIPKSEMGIQGQIYMP